MAKSTKRSSNHSKPPTTKSDKPVEGAAPTGDDERVAEWFKVRILDQARDDAERRLLSFTLENY